MSASSPDTNAVPHKAGLVFRLSLFPRNYTIQDLDSWLSLWFKADKVRLDLRHSTLCPSCLDSETQIALLHFQPHPPRALQDLPDNEIYQFNILSHYMSIDKNFHSLTQLYPTTGDIKADVVALSGLNGHAYGSWAGIPDDEGEKQMWLRHFLSRDLPDYRTMIYGYNSNLSSDSIHKIRDFTESLLEELMKAREQECEKNRPIIFIGHSFGGVIITQAFVLAKDYDDIYPGLYSSTQTAIFFGTPHRGLIVDDILSMIEQGSARKDLVQSLEKDADGLKDGLQKFINYSSRKNLQIISFKEMGRTRKLKKDSDGKWGRIGDYHIAVDQQSSILQLPNTIEKAIPVEGDDSTMVKFQGPGNPAYRSTLKYLRIISNDTRQVGSISHSSPPVPRCDYQPKYVQRGRGFSPVAYRQRRRELIHPAAYQAVVNQDALGLQELLQKIPAIDVNSFVIHNGKATYFLHIASASGDEATMRVLLSHGADVETLIEGELTALHEGASRGFSNAVSILLEGGANVNAKTFEKWSALHLAAVSGHEGVVEVLLRHGADINVRNGTGKTSLHLAASCGNLMVVKELLAHQVDIEAMVGGRTALDLAAARGHKEVEKLLRQTRRRF